MATRQPLSELVLRPFTEADYPAYRSWFADPDLEHHLGPKPDDEWLQVILTEEDGDQYAVDLAGELVAVVGTNHPCTEFPHYMVTDIAVRPDLRFLGIATAVVRLLLAKHRASWAAWVARSNAGARALFHGLGWQEEDVPGEEMLLFRSQ